MFGMKPEVPAIDVATLAGERQGRENLQIIDVREREEWQEGHLSDAMHLPLSELTTRLPEIDRARPVVFVCRSGARSAKATELLVARGFTDVRNLTGGLIAWSQAGYPMVK